MSDLTREQQALNAFLLACKDQGMDGEAMQAALPQAQVAAQGEVPCRHEAYQGACIHCNAIYVLGVCSPSHVLSSAPQSAVAQENEICAQMVINLLDNTPNARRIAQAIRARHAK